MVQETLDGLQEKGGQKEKGIRRKTSRRKIELMLCL